MKELRKFRLLFYFVLLLLGTSCSYKKKITATNLTLDPIYGSNMVFKSGDSIIIKGTCSKNGVFAAKIQDGIKYVEADIKGEWKVAFPPIDYEGSFSIVIEGVDEKFELKNLATGQVWVILGDAWLNDDVEEIEGKAYLKGRGSNKEVRIFTMSNWYHTKAKSNGKWVTLTGGKKNYKDFYASILGDEISNQSGEAIGIINLTCQGTSIKDFVGQGNEHMVPMHTTADSLWKDYFKQKALYKYLADSSFKGVERGVLDRLYDDWEWSELSMPIIISKRRYLSNRILWLRKKIYVANKFINSDFTIDLGALRGQFDFYFNGVHLDRLQGEEKNYKLLVPDTLVKVWSNLLTVRMVTGDSLSGIYSKEPKVHNADSGFFVSIAEGWKFRTYYEPKLPDIRRDKYLWPSINKDYVARVKDVNVNSIVLTGGVKQYYNTGLDDILQALKSFNSSFNSTDNYIYLIPLPEYIDSLVNIGYHNSLRNYQLIAAAKNGWEIVNTIKVGDNGKEQFFQEDMVNTLLKKIN